MVEREGPVTEGLSPLQHYQLAAAALGTSAGAVDAGRAQAAIGHALCGLLKARLEEAPTPGTQWL